MNLTQLIVLPIFSLSLLATSCKDDEVPKVPTCPNCNFTCLDENEQGEIATNDCITNWDCSYTFYQNAKVEYSVNQTFQTATVNTGDKLVFEAILSTEGSPEIADDELTRTIYFELDPTQESFSAEADDLKLLNTRYQNSCYCVDLSYKKPISGCMQGQKIDEENWQVQANFVVQFDFGDVPVKFDAVFSK